MLHDKHTSIDWILSHQPISYPEAINAMEERINNIYKGLQNEVVWILEHPSIYTAGTSAKDEELIDKTRFPIFVTGRGGRYTYHGPGQKVFYLMINLNQYKNDVKLYVENLEEWLIKSLYELNVLAVRSEKGIGVWVNKNCIGEKKLEKQKKIAAIGIRVRKWITFHGVALNIDPCLEHFNGIIPCGINEVGVTSLKELGATTHFPLIESVMRKNFELTFSRHAIKKTQIRL